MRLQYLLCVGGICLSSPAIAQMLAPCVKPNPPAFGYAPTEFELRRQLSEASLYVDQVAEYLECLERQRRDLAAALDRCIEDRLATDRDALVAETALLKCRASAGGRP